MKRTLLIIGLLTWIAAITWSQEGQRPKRVYPVLAFKDSESIKVLIYAEGYDEVTGYHVDVTYDNTALDADSCAVVGSEWDFRGCNIEAAPNEIKWAAEGADPPVDMYFPTKLAKLYFDITDTTETAAMVAVDHVSTGLPGAAKDTIYVDLTP